LNDTADRAWIVALTGGIACGKTAVSDQFKYLGVPVIDTDVIARDLVAPGKPLLKEIIGLFGERIVDKQGHLKRRKLRKRIFRKPKERKKLEALLHPAIREEATRQILLVESSYCLLVIPLLAESNGTFMDVDRVLVVDTDPENQVLRLMLRDQVTRKQAQAALDAQASREQRLAMADDVIDNSGTRAFLAAEVKQLHERYLDLSGDLL
jgi:dephospho-CoA kinase